MKALEKVVQTVQYLEILKGSEMVAQLGHTKVAAMVPQWE